MGDDEETVVMSEEDEMRDLIARTIDQMRQLAQVLAAKSELDARPVDVRNASLIGNALTCVEAIKVKP